MLLLESFAFGGFSLLGSFAFDGFSYNVSVNKDFPSLSKGKVLLMLRCTLTLNVKITKRAVSRYQRL